MAKKKGMLRQFFGVSQADMAVLLKISPAQWSMFESGRRELPQEARMEYYKMIAYFQSAKDEAAKRKPEPVEPNEKTIKKIKASLLKNQHRQMITAKKINALRKKQANAETAMHLKGYFENNKEGQPEYIHNYIVDILKRAKEDAQLSESAEMIELEVKLKVLQYEEKLLKAALEKTKY